MGVFDKIGNLIASTFNAEVEHTAKFDITGGKLHIQDIDGFIGTKGADAQGIEALCEKAGDNLECRSIVGADFTTIYIDGDNGRYEILYDRDKEAYVSVDIKSDTHTTIVTDMSREGFDSRDLVKIGNDDYQDGMRVSEFQGDVEFSTREYFECGKFEGSFAEFDENGSIERITTRTGLDARGEGMQTETIHNFENGRETSVQITENREDGSKTQTTHEFNDGKETREIVVVFSPDGAQSSTIHEFNSRGAVTLEIEKKVDSKGETVVDTERTIRYLSNGEIRSVFEDRIAGITIKDSDIRGDKESFRTIETAGRTEDYTIYPDGSSRLDALTEKGIDAEGGEYTQSIKYSYPRDGGEPMTYEFRSTAYSDGTHASYTKNHDGSSITRQISLDRRGNPTEITTYKDGEMFSVEKIDGEIRSFRTIDGTDYQFETAVYDAKGELIERREYSQEGFRGVDGNFDTRETVRMDGDTQITTRISDGKQEVAMETVVDGEVRTERIITYSSDWGDTSKIQTITETVDKGESVKSIFTTEKDEKTGMETRYETYEREIGGDYHELTKFFNDGDRRIETWSSDVKSENGPRTFDETTVHDKESIVTREVKVDGDGKEYIATEVKFLNREDGNGFDNKTEKSITVDKYSEDGSKISSTKYYETGRYDRDGQHGEKGISTSWSNDNKDYIVSASQDKYTQDTKETVTIRSHDGDTVVEKSYAVDGDKMELTFSREYLKCEDGQYLTVSTERYDIGESPERIDVPSDVRDTLDTMSEKIEELSVEKTFMEEIVDTEIIEGTPPDDGYPPDDGIDGGAVDADSSQCEQEPNPDRDPIDVENPADNEDSADETPDTDNSEQTSFDDDLDSDFNDN